MEMYAPVMGMILICTGVILVLAGIGGLMYSFWPRLRS